jgi:branched-chain amino acid transport system substrate-binding protein
MKKSLYLFITLFFVVAINGCNDSESIPDPNKVSSHSVKFGGIFPFTGTLSEPAKQFHNSALLAVKHLGEAGYPVGWAVADSETNEKVGVRVARELIERGGVQVLFCSYASSVTMPVARQVSIPLQVPQISYGATSTDITKLPEDEGQDFLFRTSPADNLQGSVLAKLAMDENYTQVAVLYAEKNPYSVSIKDVFVEQFKARGGTVVSLVGHFNYETDEFVEPVDYGNELAEAARGGSKTLVALSYLGHANDYVKQAIEGYGFENFLFVDGTKSIKLFDTVGGNRLEGMCGTAPSSKESESLTIFDNAYREEYGEADYTIMKSLALMSNSYDAVMVAGLAAYAVQAIGQEVTPLAIRENLRRVANPEGEKVGAGLEELKRAMKILDTGLSINYEGASGSVDFDEDGDVVTPVEIWCYEGGKIKSRQICDIDNLNAEPFAEITCENR